MAYGFYYGYSRGIISTVLTLAGYVFGVIFAFKAMSVTAGALESLFSRTHPLMSAAAFILNLGLVMLLLRMVSRGAENILDSVYLGIFNRIAGGVFMALFAALIFSVLLWFGAKAQLVRRATLEASLTYPAFLQSMPGRARFVFVWLKPIAGEAWGASMKWMNKLEDVDVPDNTGKPKIYSLPDDGSGIEDETESEPPNRRSGTETEGLE